MSAAPSPATPPLAFDPLGPPDWHDPYPTYRRLRDEAPVHYSAATESYSISRYDDVVSVLRQPDLFSSSSAFDLLFRQAMSGFGWRDVFALARFVLRAGANVMNLREGPKQSMIMLDPPRHGELRGLVNRGFTPRRIEAWQGRAEEIVERCMDGIHSRPSFDVVRDLAVPLPVEVIAEMLGIDAEHRADFKRWSDQTVAGVSSSDPSRNRPAFLDAVTHLSRHLRGVVAARRADPQDDLISLLVDPRHGETLDDAALLQFVMLLLVAGNETTTNLIGNATVTLLRHPDQLDRVIAQPELIPGMIEEVLRYDGPVHFVLRRATRDVEVAGTRIPADSRVAVLLGSANRDERRFPDPDRFDVTRDTKGHVGFGLGTHFCLGASLARLEAQAALRALVPELPHLRTREPEPPLVESVLIRGRSRIELERVAE